MAPRPIHSPTRGPEQQGHRFPTVTDCARALPDSSRVGSSHNSRSGGVLGLASVTGLGLQPSGATQGEEVGVMLASLWPILGQYGGGGGKSGGGYGAAGSAPRTGRARSASAWLCSP